MAIITLGAAAIAATLLHGQLTDVRGHDGARYDFGSHAGAVFVLHHFAVEIGCDGHLRGPSIAGPTFDQIATDYAAGPGSRVQVLDISNMDAPDWYAWWVDTTAANHPVLQDDREDVLTQLDSLSGWPDVMIVDCHGAVKFKQQIFATARVYRDELKPVIDAALADTTCP